MEERAEAVRLGTAAALSWQPKRETWRCCCCGKLDGPDTGEYTDGFCVACLWTRYTEQAVPVLILMVKDGKPLR